MTAVVVDLSGQRRIVPHLVVHPRRPVMRLIVVRWRSQKTATVVDVGSPSRKRREVEVSRLVLLHEHDDAKIGRRLALVTCHINSFWNRGKPTRLAGAVVHQYQSRLRQPQDDNCGMGPRKTAGPCGLQPSFSKLKLAPTRRCLTARRRVAALYERRSAWNVVSVQLVGQLDNRVTRQTCLDSKGT